MSGDVHVRFREHPRGKFPRVTRHAFIESWFRTLKYVPGYPSRGFADIEQARQWCHRFVSWYNDEHHHREIGYVTPNQRHNGQSAQVLARRRQVYEGGTPKASGALERECAVAVFQWQGGLRASAAV